ncbi:reverse transcriptase domain-containing protein [Tanacetum coccineum]
MSHQPMRHHGIAMVSCLLLGARFTKSKVCVIKHIPKGQILKELRDNTFSGSDHEDANEDIEKVLEIVNLFHIPNITQDQEMLRAFPISLTRVVSRWLRNKPSGSITNWEDLKIKFIGKYCLPSHTAKKMEEINNFQQEPDETLYQAWERLKEILMKCPQHYLTEMQEVILLYNGLDVQIRQIHDSKGASISVMPLSTYLNLGLGELAHTKLTVELADITVKYLKGIAENVQVGIGKFVFPVDFIIIDMPEDVKVPFILGRPFLSTAHAKIDVFKRKITLRVGDEKIIFKSIKPASSLIKRVYMLSLRERIELDLEVSLMGETLVLNRSLDPLYGDYIELNDLNVLLELKRDQVDDLMPTIEEGEVIDEPMIDIIKTRNNESFDEYPSFCDFDRKIHIDHAYNLRFSCMIGFKHVSAIFFPILFVNMMSREFYNSIIKDKVELKGKNVVGAFMNVPIFVRNFSVVTRFVVLENIDGYRDQDMGDIILGEPFCKASCVEAKRFDGLITIYNGSDNVTYQMARSHPRFKHLSNAQCNKIKPLLKVSLHDKLNGISHPYQKLKSFYKGVLNLGPEYV